MIGGPTVVLAIAAMVALNPEPQAQVNSGRSLDHNLMVGSGGYNFSTPHYGTFTQPRYGPGTTRDIYSAGRYGEMRYNANRAFSSPRYTPTGSNITERTNQAFYEDRGSMHRGYNPSYHRRFRYQ